MHSRGDSGKTGKELVLRENEEDKDKAGSEESSIQSVSGIINSVRETRAATQRQGTAAAGGMYRQKQHYGEKGKTEGAAKRGAEHPIPEPPYAAFNTYRLVRRLMEAGYSSDQAKTILSLFKHQVYESVERVKANMLTKSDLENDAYLFRAALQELRTETQMIRKNDQAILESQLAAIDREIESLAQKINDDVSNVRSDIEIEMNNHKHDTNHAMKSLDMELHKLSSKYQFVVGEMKTDVEAIRLESIRHGLLAAVVTTLVLVGIVWAPELLKQLRERDSQARQRSMKSRDNDGVSVAEIEDTNGGLGLQMAGDAVLAAQKEKSEDELRRAVWAASGDDDSKDRLQSAQRASQTNGVGSRYRDHSFLTINYDPTIFSQDQQKQQQQQQRQQNENADEYDNWFDSFFSTPQDDGRQEGEEKRKGKSASLMDSDAKLDATLWNQQPSPTAASDNDQGEETNK
ncbi:hypothetical protein EV175_001988 [Coemansia sp. RSA 1933]|nr:hypothetical protein EV175_001988 [Coemansia sp. RSA 1933]